MGLLSNSINKESLKAGDHIYSWRTAYIYAHHGIYIGDDKVIHFTRRGQEVGTGKVMDFLQASSAPRYVIHCSNCTAQEGDHGVVLSCLNCFLAEGVLYRFEYAVSPAFFHAKVRSGTCTLAVSDPDDIVVHRAKYLLDNDFGCYNVLTKNCEHFAMYCKTGLLVIDQGTVGQSGQRVAIITSSLTALFSTALRVVTTTSVFGIVGATIGSYCKTRYDADIGRRRDVLKVSVENLKWLATDSLQVMEPQMIMTPIRESQ